MKKAIGNKKLALNKGTLRKLSDSNLGQVQGGKYSLVTNRAEDTCKCKPTIGDCASVSNSAMVRPTGRSPVGADESAQRRAHAVAVHRIFA